MSNKAPWKSRSVSKWAEYLSETNQTVSDIINGTNSSSLASWLMENKEDISSRIKRPAVTMSNIKMSVLSLKEAEAFAETASPNEPDKQENPQPSSPQKGTKV